MITREQKAEALQEQIGRIKSDVEYYLSRAAELVASVEHTKKQLEDVQTWGAQKQFLLATLEKDLANL